nr:phage baseplate assembly protein [Candidatus Hamiltonella defensa]
MKNVITLLQRTLSRLWSRGVVERVNSTAACQKVDVALMAGETK